MNIKLYKLFVPLFTLLFSAGANAQIISTVVGDGTNGYTGDGGAALSATCTGPREVDVDWYGNLYIADAGNNVIRKVSASDNKISTVAGNGTAGYSGDGGAAVSATLFKPSWVSVDNAGNLYIADIGNYVVRKVNTSGIISTIAGNGTLGYTGDGAKASSAELGWPFAVVPDNSGDIYISDYYNNCIRKVNSAGTISTVAGISGSPGYSGDGSGAVNAKLSEPAGISLDHANNLYIADYANHVIRKVSAAGIITTVAGNGTSADAGDGGAAVSASFIDPIAVAVDATGNPLISDPGASRVRYVQSSSGTISTYAGNGTVGYTGDGGHNYSAEVNNPAGGIMDHYGNFFFADQNNNVIRAISSGNIQINGVKPVRAPGTDMGLFPNPNNGVFTIRGTLGSVSSESVLLEVTDMVGQVVYRNTVTAPSGNISSLITLDNGLPGGMYLLHVTGGAAAAVIRFAIAK